MPRPSSSSTINDQVALGLSRLNIAGEWAHQKTSGSASVHQGHVINLHPNTESPAPVPSRIWLVPFGPNKNFVGRDSILQSLIEEADPHANTKYCQRIAVVGLGGVGKTQIALEAAHRIYDKHSDCSVFWVPAIDATSFENAYRKIGRKLGVEGIDGGTADVKQLVRDALSHQDSGPWLLIVDNADDAKLLLDRSTSSLSQFLPSNKNGSILLTTRNRDVAVDLIDSADDIVPVGEMSDAEAHQLLTRGLADKQMRDPESITSLLDFLANLPLAIKQATTYIAKTGVTISRYLSHCQSSEETTIKLLSRDFEDRGRYGQTKNPIATTWLISFEHISRDNQLAAQYLRFVCFLGDKDIPISLLPSADDEIDADEAIGALKAYAFITLREDQESFDIHRLVQLAMRNWIYEKGEQGGHVREAIQRFAETYPSPDLTNRSVWMKYLPHAYSVLQFREIMVEHDEVEASFMSQVGRSLGLQAKFSEAEAICRQTLELREKVLGHNHPRTLLSMIELGSTLLVQDKYKEAETIQRLALEKLNTVLGHDHPLTLNSLDNLGRILESQGKYAEAEAIHRQALELSKKVLDCDNKLIIASMVSLGNVLSFQSRLDEAEATQRRALELSQKLLGYDHPSTLISIISLGLILQDQGKYDDAEVMHRQGLKLNVKLLGYSHPFTLDSVDNLRLVLEAQGKYDEAEQLRKDMERRQGRTA